MSICMDTLLKRPVALVAVGFVNIAELTAFIARHTRNEPLQFPVQYFDLREGTIESFKVAYDHLSQTRSCKKINVVLANALTQLPPCLRCNISHVLCSHVVALPFVFFKDVAVLIDVESSKWDVIFETDGPAASTRTDQILHPSYQSP